MDRWQLSGVSGVLALALALGGAVAAGCEDGTLGGSDLPTGGAGGATGSGTGAGGEPSPGRLTWEAEVQPRIAARCGPCHVGARFAFASLARAGESFTPEETEANYQTFLTMISLDAPGASRLLGKMASDPSSGGSFHAAGPVAGPGDDVFDVARAWIDEEKAFRCPDCGLSAPAAWLAYVEQPELFWALPADPFRSDHGLRDRARILLQPIDPATSKPVGEAVDFLGDSFCGADGRCDFGSLAVSHAGDRLVFECRLSLEPADWVADVRWNVCIAEIGPDGRAQDPRFLLPPERRHAGSTVARSDPFGDTLGDGQPLKGPYDLHFQVRRRADRHPVFSPDDARVYFASEAPEPRSGVSAVQAYHGFEHLGHIVAVSLDGSDPRTIYVNEGGVADQPFFLKNGNVAFHTWNLERMDRHLYTQATADGMMELPVLLGRVQGPNMWGKAVQLGGGAIFGVTGRRRSSIDNYVPFVADHTLGTGIEAGVPALAILDTEVFEQVIDFPTGYCVEPPDGPSCAIDRYYADPAYAPDGRAFVAHNPERTYVSQGEAMYLGYSSGATEAERVESMRPYVPKNLGISLIDAKGQLERVLDPEPGTMMRFPAWVGRRQAPRAQVWKTEEADASAELHIADVPIWFSFRHSDGTTNKSNTMEVLGQIVALRVLVKELGGNFCLNDGRPYRFAANDGAHDHPTHLGKNNASGYTRLAVPAAAGGDAFGDVPLRADRSVRLRLPAGKLLLFQGIDAAGHAVAQRSRLLSLAPGHRVDTSVRASQYASQCLSCHGGLAAGETFTGLGDYGSLPFVAMDFDTEAAAAAPVDLIAAPERPATFRAALRPLIDQHCVGCHSGPSPGGELSLESAYSAAGNYPAGKWASAPGLADPAYLAFVPAGSRVPSYAYSVSFAWNFREDEPVYKDHPAYAGAIASHAPLAGLAPWDPAYQNLFAHDGSRWVYLGGYFNPNFGRSDRLGGLSSDSWLLEILTGKDLDPTRGALALDHTGMLSDAEVREVMAVVDVGFAYMARCDDAMVSSGPNAGEPWGDPGD